jgi:hypothetical protein
MDIVYDKFVYSYKKFKILYFNVHHHVVVKEKLSWLIFNFFTITLVTRGTPKESQIKLGHFLRTYLNISKNYYQTRSNREMLQHDYHFFGNLMIFFPQKSDWMFFSYIFFTFVQIFKQKKISSWHVYLFQ